MMTKKIVFVVVLVGFLAMVYADGNAYGGYREPVKRKNEYRENGQM